MKIARVTEKYCKIIKVQGIMKFLEISKKNFVFLLKKMFLSKDGFLLKKIHGSWMYLNVKEGGIATTLAIDGERELLETEIVKKELKKGMRVLDIGANIGYYALLEASIITGTGKVYAIEPAPRNVEMLNMNVKKNKYSDIIKTYQMAVSDKTGFSDLQMSEMANLHTMITPAKGNAHEASSSTLRVKTVRIDDFLVGKKGIDFIRMDIEGFECEAIDGMLDSLKKSSSIRIMMELHPTTYGPKRDFGSKLKKLIELGFKARYVVSAGYRLPRQFSDLGYTPTKVIREGKFQRGLFENVQAKDLPELTCVLPKIVRAVYLEKTEE